MENLKCIQRVACSFRGTICSIDSGQVDDHNTNNLMTISKWRRTRNHLLSLLLCLNMLCIYFTNTIYIRLVLDDCWVNPDCNNGGRCYDISTYYPRRQCFCAPGFFGKSCNKSIQNYTYLCLLYSRQNRTASIMLQIRLLNKVSAVQTRVSGPGCGDRVDRAFTS